MGVGSVIHERLRSLEAARPVNKGRFTYRGKTGLRRSRCCECERPLLETSLISGLSPSHARPDKSRTGGDRNAGWARGISDLRLIARALSAHVMAYRLVSADSSKIWEERFSPLELVDRRRNGSEYTVQLASSVLRIVSTSDARNDERHTFEH